MIIIAGHELVSTEIRDQYVDAFSEMVSRARDFDGCIHFAMTADSVDPERVNIVEIWRDAEALEKWRKQAKGPSTADPKYFDVKRYDATDGGPLF
jgi:quinol monooxygenase YgiN